MNDSFYRKFTLSMSFKALNPTNWTLNSGHPLSRGWQLRKQPASSAVQKMMKMGKENILFHHLCLQIPFFLFNPNFLIFFNELKMSNFYKSLPINISLLFINYLFSVLIHIPIYDCIKSLEIFWRQNQNFDLMVRFEFCLFILPCCCTLSIILHPIMKNLC